MKMKHICYVIILFSISFASKITDSCNNRISELFPNLISSNHSIYEIDKKDKKNIQNIVKQKFFRNEVNLWRIIDKDSLKYFSILDNVIGKTMPISFLATYNHNGEVHDVSIIKYREPYGGEIKSKSWLRQFTAYTDSSNYKVGDSIEGISGATLSVNSVSKGMHKLSHLIHEIIKESNE